MLRWMNSPDERITAALDDGHLRTAAELAGAVRLPLSAVVAAVAALDRLAAQRRVRKSGYAPPQTREYGAPWPTLWGRAA